MEHIVQFAIGVDDDKIREICEAKCAEQVVKDVIAFSHGTNYYGKPNDKPDKLRYMFEEQIKIVIDEHRDEIIAGAIAELTKNLQRSKKVREAVGDILKEIK